MSDDSEDISDLQAAMGLLVRRVEKLEAVNRQVKTPKVGLSYHKLHDPELINNVQRDAMLKCIDEQIASYQPVGMLHTLSNDALKTVRSFIVSFSEEHMNHTYKEGIGD